MDTSKCKEAPSFCSQLHAAMLPAIYQRIDCEQHSQCENDIHDRMLVPVDLYLYRKDSD